MSMINMDFIKIYSYSFSAAVLPIKVLINMIFIQNICELEVQCIN